MAIKSIPNLNDYSRVSDTAIKSATKTTTPPNVIKTIPNINQTVRDLNTLLSNYNYAPPTQQTYKTIPEATKTIPQALLDTIPRAKEPPLILAASTAEKIISGPVLKTIDSQAAAQGADLQKIATAAKPSTESLFDKVIKYPSGLKEISDGQLQQMQKDVVSISKSPDIKISDPNYFKTISPGARAASESFLKAIEKSFTDQKLVIQAELTGGKGVEGLRDERNIGQMLDEALSKHPEFYLSPERQEEIVKYYPEIGLALLTGETEAKHVNEWFMSRDNLLAQGKSVGLMTSDDELRIAVFVAYTKRVGAPEAVSQSIVSQYINNLDSQSREKMSNWINGPNFMKDCDNALKAANPTDTVKGWMKDDSNQLYMTAGTILIGGVTGLALKGLAGLGAGAMMGVFAGTEIPNLANTNVFAETQIRKLEAAGIKDASATIGGYKAEYDSITQIYNSALKAGNLAEADRQAYKLQQLGDRYANYIDDNWAAYERAGILADTRADVIANYDAASKNRFTEGEPAKKAGAYKLESFDPKSDWVRVNGITLQYFNGNEITLPPGDYEIEWGRTGYDPTTRFVSIDKEGDVYSGDPAVLNKDRKAQYDKIVKDVDAVLDPFTGQTRTTVAEKTAEYTAGVEYGIIWQDGWQVQDPYTLEWKKSGNIFVKGDGTTNVLFKDPSGATRYTRITNNDPFQAKYITGLESMPYQPSKVEKYEPAKKTGEGVVMFGSDRQEGVKYYFDGVEITERMVGTRVRPGDHTLIMLKDGFKPTEVKVSITDGETSHLSLARVLTPEPEPYQKQSYSGGGGGGGGGSSSPAPASYGQIIFGETCRDAQIFLDEQLTEPVLGQAYSISPGYHAIKLKKPGFKDWLKTVYIIAGDTLTVNAAFEASTAAPPVQDLTPDSTATTKRVYVNSSPEGGKILINGQWSGQWSPGYIDLVPGYYLIGILKTGYKTQQAPLWVSDVVAWGETALALARINGVAV